jgi:hypothetical protein
MGPEEREVEVETILHVGGGSDVVVYAIGNVVG